jgi:hypothetical protein
LKKVNIYIFNTRPGNPRPRTRSISGGAISGYRQEPKIQKETFLKHCEKQTFKNGGDAQVMWGTFLKLKCNKFYTFSPKLQRIKSPTNNPNQEQIKQQLISTQIALNLCMGESRIEKDTRKRYIRDAHPVTSLLTFFFYLSTTIFLFCELNRLFSTNYSFIRYWDFNFFQHSFESFR